MTSVEEILTTFGNKLGEKMLQTPTPQLGKVSVRVNAGIHS